MTTNFFVTPSSQNAIDALLFGTRWNAAGSLSLTFSFPGYGSAWDFFNGYYTVGSEPDTGFAPFAGTQERQAYSDALAQWESVAGVSFTEVPETQFSYGDLRVAYSTYPPLNDPHQLAYTWLPDAGLAQDGDTWLNADLRGGLLSSYAAGGVAAFTLLHETGHALGLKHPAEPSDFNSVQLPAAADSLFNSVMSTNVWVGVPVTLELNIDRFPTTPMALDIDALQYLYGARQSHGGDDVYSFSALGKYLETLYDTGGIDSIVAIGAAAAEIDLRPGEWSRLGVPVQIQGLTQPDGLKEQIQSADTVRIYRLSIIENAIGGDGGDTLIGNEVANRLEGGAGNDSLDGGAGIDTALFSGARAAYSITRDPGVGFTVSALSGADGLDFVRNVELLGFSDSITLLVSPTTDAGIVDHFNPYHYLDSNPDLLAFYGADAAAATLHFLNWGWAEGRSPAAFNAFWYLASNPDLLAVYGPNPLPAIEHYARWGAAEGRPTAGFDAFEYLASNPDVLAAFGASAAGAIEHYVRWGAAEGRATSSFDAFEYLASNPDVLAVFGASAAGGVEHYVRWGVAEGRATTSFDAFLYLASNADLLSVFGANAGAAVDHYVRWGFGETRPTSGFDALRYVAGNPDLIPFFGSNAAAAVDHYVHWGAAEGRSSTGFDALRYIASYTDLMNSLGADANAGELSFIQGGAAQGRSTSFDAQAYLNSSPDLLAYYGADLDGAAAHYINWGRFEGRAATFTGDGAANSLYGQAGPDTLYGLTGNDTLAGGAGADQFVFNSALNAVTNLDRVMDFTPGVDKLVLDDAIFGALAGGNLADKLVAGANPAPVDADDFVLYDTVTGQMSYDPDGNAPGGAGATAFAIVLSHWPLSAADFAII